MKGNKMSKVLAAALCLSMTATVPVCAEAGSEMDTSPITLTIGVKDTGFALGDGIHSEELRVLKEIEEKTGVTLDFVTYSLEKYGVMAASGDMPDIVLTWDDTTTMSLIESGQFMALDDLLDQYGENIKKNIPDGLAYAKTLYGNGESTYFMPTCVKSVSSTPAENGFVGFRARYDIYKAIGSPEITSEDDYLNVLKQMQDYQREQTGDDSIYALSAWTDWGAWPYIICYPFSHGYMDSSSNSSIDIATGELHHNFMEEDGVFWNGISFFNKAYRMGIFDPDGFVMTGAQYQDKVKSGKVLVDMIMSQPDTTICGEEVICVYLPGTAFPYISGVYASPYPYGQKIINARAISTNCENPERAMQLLNWLDSVDGMRTLENGVQGVDWDYVDGVPQFIGDTLAAFQTNDTEYITNEIDLGATVEAMYSGLVATEDGYPIKLETSTDFLASKATVAEKNFAQDYDESFSFPGQVYDKWVKEGMVTTDLTDEGLKIASLAPVLSTDSTAKEAEATNYFMSNVAKLITADSDEAFAEEKAAMMDKFVELGLEETAAELQANGEAAVENYNAINNK